MGLANWIQLGVALLMVSPLASAPAAAAAGRPAVLGAHGLLLPATFEGDLPCADCPGIRHHLDLWPDQVFVLRRTWIGRDASQDDIGRWHVDPERRALVLWGGKEMPLQFEIVDDRRLRQLDLDGKPIVSDLPYELVSKGMLDPVDVHLYLAGMFVYFADAARLNECLTGRSFPVAMEGDYRRLEQAYLEARQSPAQPLMVTFEGGIEQRPRIEGEGTEATAVVKRFVNVWPNEVCERHQAEASLINTYWRIVKLGDQAVGAVVGRREPHLLLTAGEPRFRATVGCNQLAGGYERSGETIRFGPAAATRMACAPPLDALESRLAEALRNTEKWRIHGQFLELTDRDGRSVALLQAVYLR
jgi:heat shock protein HslJ